MASQYGAYARLYARIRMHTPTRPGTHMHARTRKHVHAYQYIILIAIPRRQLFRERATVLLYTYIAYLVCNWMQQLRSIMDMLRRYPMRMRVIATCLLHHGNYLPWLPQSFTLLHRSSFIMPVVARGLASWFSCRTHSVSVTADHVRCHTVVLWSGSWLRHIFQSYAVFSYSTP
jgi:hypothetical protein